MGPDEFEFRVCWQTRPHVHSTKSVMFVIAKTKEAAEHVARDEIERRHGIDAWDGITVWSVDLYLRPQGRAVE